MAALAGSRCRKSSSITLGTQGVSKLRWEMNVNNLPRVRLDNLNSPSVPKEVNQPLVPGKSRDLSILFRGFDQRKILVASSRLQKWKSSLQNNYSLWPGDLSKAINNSRIKRNQKLRFQIHLQQFKLEIILRMLMSMLRHGYCSKQAASPIHNSTVQYLSYRQQ
jgi:hypothetical protein